MEEGHQTLKTRDDYVPVSMHPDPAESDPDKPFRISVESECSWANNEKPIGSETLRQRIEPWLTALLQSEHLSLLVGSGLTRAIHGMVAPEPLSWMSNIEFNVLNDKIAAEAKRVAETSGRKIGNFEDQIRVASELLRGLEIVGIKKADGAAEDDEATILRNDLSGALKSFTESILKGERDLAFSPVKKREKAFNYLVRFLTSFSSRSGTRERLHLFTTNYDRYLEAGADAAGLRLIDRFVGTLAPVFRASRLDIDLHYNPPGIRGEPRYLEGVARFTKLHGSVDWADLDGAIRRFALPFGAQAVAPFLTKSGTDDMDVQRLMVYPNSAKDRETAYYPYVELFRDFATAICRPNSTLVCYGYSFGDEHINRVVEDMLTIPSTHLVIISYSDPLDRIINTFEKLGRHAQITLLVGDHLGDLVVLVDRYLPKSAIDRTTYRMAEILKARWTTLSLANDADQEATPDQDGTTK